MAFSAEQCGAYILLLSYQWMNGFVPDDDSSICTIGRCSSAAVASLRKKFQKDETDGVLRNLRLERVRQEQIEYRSKQAENGRKGGNATKRRSSDATSNAQATLEQRSSSPSHTPSLHERESHFPECNGRPTLKEVLARADIEGLAAWKAEDWWNEMQGCGWLDFSHRPIRDWTAVLTRVRTKWESDGRPKSPPKPKHQPKDPNDSPIIQHGNF